MAIRGFRHRGLRDLFVEGRGRRINPRFHGKIVDLLDILDAATGTRDLVGVSTFHALKGDRKGTFSMVVSRNWRITFRLQRGDVLDVDWEDYH